MNDKGGIFYGSFKPCKPDTVNYGINNQRYSVLIPFKIDFLHNSPLCKSFYLYAAIVRRDFCPLAGDL